MSGEDPLSDLQLRSIAAASDVCDRLTAELTGAPAPYEAPRASANGASDPVGQQQLRAAAARTIDLFAGLFQQAFETYVELAQSLVQPPLSGVAVSAGACADLALASPAGGNAAATIWIHNATDRCAENIVLRLTDLHDHSGARIDASLARFVPGALHVEGGASASSMLSLAIPARAAPGLYFGHVLAAGLPAAGLPVRMVVDEAQA